jgi:hypothetical protein
MTVVLAVVLVTRMIVLALVLAVIPTVAMMFLRARDVRVVVTVVTVAAAVVLATTMLVSALVAVIPTVIPVVAMMFLIMRNVLAAIPVFVHKEDPLAAGPVLVAVPAPVFCVVSGHAQVDRRAVKPPALNDNRLPRDQSRLRKVTDVETTIEIGLADAERETDIGGG